MDNTTVKNRLKVLAEKQYKLNGCERAQAVIDKMDAGDIIKQYPLTIDPYETYASLYDKLCVLAGDVISKDFMILFDKNLQSIP